MVLRASADPCLDQWKIDPEVKRTTAQTVYLATFTAVHAGADAMAFGDER